MLHFVEEETWEIISALGTRLDGLLYPRSDFYLESVCACNSLSPLPSSSYVSTSLSRFIYLIGGATARCPRVKTKWRGIKKLDEDFSSGQLKLVQMPPIAMTFLEKKRTLEKEKNEIHKVDGYGRSRSTMAAFLTITWGFYFFSSSFWRR